MKGINDLGSGYGWLYTVKASDGTIASSSRNNAEGARDIKVNGVRAQSTALGRVATGTILITQAVSSSSITNITIGGVSQVNAATSISYTSATTVASIATSIAEAINLHTPSVGNYTATAVNGLVTVTDNSGSGSAANSDTIQVLHEDVLLLGVGSSLLGVTTNIEGGASGTDLYDAFIGFRFYINANYSAGGTATPSSLTDAIEITNYIIPRSLTSSLDHQKITVVTESISFSRKSSITSISLDTEASAAANDLKTISTVGFANFDRILFIGSNPLKVITFKSTTGNIKLQGNVDFATGGPESAIELQLSEGIWYEMARSTQTIGSILDFRAAGYGIFTKEILETQTVATGGSVNWVAGTNGVYQDITGSSTLLSSLSYNVTGGISGDEIIVRLNASVILNGFSLNIMGITLTQQQALGGGMTVRSRYLGASGWKSELLLNLDSSQAYGFRATSEFIKDGAVIASKLSTDVRTELLTTPVSWDVNRIGDYKIKIPFACTVVEINAFATSTIEVTNDAGLNFKNANSVSMGSGVLTRGNTIGDGMTTLLPTSNNVFVKDSIMTISTTKVTPGGHAQLNIKIIKS